MAEFAQIERSLREGNHVNDQTMDSILLSPVAARNPNLAQQSRERFGFRNPMAMQNIRRGGEGSQHYERPDRYERSDRFERSDRYERPDRYERSDRESSEPYERY